ncbi:hypothetical protein [Candidatus Methanarcanum hacksteinii]|uniref:hypothetical protein n=1 Tax=Candidatus Methanarcanum hacksteinii TaxID=2911857 RepID=UPI0037DCFDAC
MDDDGNTSTETITYEDGMMTFVTNHFSYYSIHSDFESEDNTMLYVDAAIAIITINAIVVIRKR